LGRFYSFLIASVLTRITSFSSQYSPCSNYEAEQHARGTAKAAVRIQVSIPQYGVPFRAEKYPATNQKQEYRNND